MAATRSHRDKRSASGRGGKARKRPMISADKKDKWNENILESVRQYNRWFLKFAPKAFRETRAQ